MPWHVVKDHSECTPSEPWAVVKDADGSVEACHATEQEANDHMAALYANAPEADTAAADTDEVSEVSDRVLAAKDGSCPPGMMKDPDTGDCVKMPKGMEAEGTDAEGGKPNQGTDKDKRLHENKKTKKHEGARIVFADGTEQWIVPGTTTTTANNTLTFTFPTTTFAKKADTMPTSAGWKGVLTMEGVDTGDGREFDKGALTWADLPIPLQWQKESSHGGDHDVTVQVGNITHIERKGGKILGEGVFDMGQEDGREAYRRVKEGFLKGISVVSDDITEADIELVWPEKGPEESEGEEGDLFDLLFAQPEKVIYHAGRIRASTLVDIPAFVEAFIELTDEITAAGVPTTAAEVSAVTLDRESGLAELTAAAPPTARPPAAWFENPRLSVPMNVIVTDEGRVYGHAAHWGECHIGHPEMCVTAPFEERHPYFLTGEVITDDGTRVPVGQITLATGHAPLAYDARRAAEHYDNTGTVVADVTVGNDEHGIWIAGACRDPQDRRVGELRASGKVSGDWRRIAGSLRLVGLLGVNVAGFHAPQVRSRVAAGLQLALVSAGIPHLGGSSLEREQAALRTLMDRLAARIDQG